MIRWCAYCQRFIGEVEPLTQFEISHGACATCEPRALIDDEPSAEDRQAAALFNRLFEFAAAGDVRTCGEIIHEARRLRYRTVDLLLGLIQPALGEIGARWEEGLVTVADEHRFSAWCEVAVALLEHSRPLHPAATNPRTDLLLLAAPGNHHLLGLRIASLCLAEEGLAVEHVVPELPAAEVVALTVQRAPRWVGFSCSLPEHVASAVQLAQALEQAGFRGHVMLGGQALRRDPSLAGGSGLTVCLTVEAARDELAAPD